MKLTNKQYVNDIVFTKRVMKNSKVIYFPRNQKALRKLYAIDSILSGFSENIHPLPKNSIVVDTDDNIL